MKATLQIIGQKFGSLKVVESKGRRNGNKVYLCECECGRQTVVPQGNLTRGRTKSCGDRAKHNTALKLKVNEDERTRSWLVDVSGYSYGYICRLLKQGVSPEEISMGKGIRKRSIVKREKRIIPLFGFRNVTQLANHLGMTAAGVYHRYKNGYVLEEKNGKFQFKKQDKK